MISFYGGKKGEPFIISYTYDYSSKELINRMESEILEDIKKDFNSVNGHVKWEQYGVINHPNHADHGKVYKNIFNAENPVFIGQFSGPQGESTFCQIWGTVRKEELLDEETGNELSPEDYICSESGGKQPEEDKDKYRGWLMYIDKNNYKEPEEGEEPSEDAPTEPFYELCYYNYRTSFWELARIKPGLLTPEGGEIFNDYANNKAGELSFVTGELNEGIGRNNTILGKNNISTNDSNILIGEHLKSYSDNNTILGRYNSTDRIINKQPIGSYGDLIFTIGNGDNLNQSNSLEIYKNAIEVKSPLVLEQSLWGNTINTKYIGLDSVQLDGLNGFLHASKSIVAEGDIIANKGKLTAKTDIEAGGNITCGGIISTDGEILRKETVVEQFSDLTAEHNNSSKDSIKRRLDEYGLSDIYDYTWFIGGWFLAQRDSQTMNTLIRLSTLCIVNNNYLKIIVKNVTQGTTQNVDVHVDLIGINNGFIRYKQ